MSTERNAVSIEWPTDVITQEAFLSRVREAGDRAYRNLPWRHTVDPYAILVSEVMLQQTQVARVQDRWVRWMRMFPTVDSVAAAAQADVLAEWQGLGYNRRALALKRTCDECSQHFDGRLPETYNELKTLPGIGPSTAAGVIVFAHNQPAAYVETNVRTVFMTDVFPDRSKVSDTEIAALLMQVCPVDGARRFYTNLLDYGADLKSQIKARTSDRARQAPIAKQSTFEGSRRQKRAEVVRIVLASPGITREELQVQLDAIEEASGRSRVDGDLFDGIVADLLAEGFFTHTDGRFQP